MKEALANYHIETWKLRPSTITENQLETLAARHSASEPRGSKHGNNLLTLMENN